MFDVGEIYNGLFKAVIHVVTFLFLALGYLVPGFRFPALLLMVFCIVDWGIICYHLMGELA